MKIFGANQDGRRRETTRGILLVECLVYMSVLFVVIGMALAAYYRCGENSRRLHENAVDIAQTLRAGERWRADVRAASGRLELLEADGELRIPHETGLVRYIFQNASVTRRVGQSTPSALLKNVKGSRFLLEREGDLLIWQWEVELKPATKNPKVRPLFSFQTVTRKGE